jgi:hypothetical protein
MSEIQDTGCCKKFDPAPWDDKEVVWQDKLFVKDRVRSLWHIPLNFGQVVVRNLKKIEAAGVKPEQLMPVDENSPWGADIYIAVDKEVPGAETMKLSGTFLTKIFEGPYRNVAIWMDEMRKHVAGKGREIKKFYFCYTTCPRCAKAYGKNYVVIMAQI